MPGERTGKRQVVCVAAYEDVTRALADLDAIEQLHTAKVSKRYVDAATDEIADELREALKS